MRCLLLLLVSAFLAAAHEPGLSSADFRQTRDGLELALTFAVADMDSMFLLDTDADGKVTQLEFDYARPRLLELATNAAEVIIDATPADGSAPLMRMDQMNNIEFIIRYPQKLGSTFVYRCAIFSQLPSGHRQFASLKDFNDRVLVERLLENSEDRLTFPAPRGEDGPSKTTFMGFLTLGIEHILTGYDHLLFLFALLVVTREFMPALRIITCFTIAHSITLALATFKVVNIPSHIVEPLIAATIVYVGVENIVFGGEPKQRWVVTFIFGLIHGFGFAGILRDMGIASGSSGIAVPLFSFNLGVELGQIAVAIIVLPFIWRFSKSAKFTERWVPACSGLVALAGAYWFVSRVWGA